MQTGVWGIIFISLVVIGVLLFRLWKYQRQVNHILEEIHTLKEEDTNFRLSSSCRVGKTDELINEINELNAHHKQLERILKKENKIYKESITGISHDIRTPLTSAKGYIQMLNKKEISEEKRLEYTKKVEQRLDDVTAMLNQLFEYARIEAGEMEFELEEINAVNVFADVISMFYDDFVKKGCEPKVEIPERASFILADRQAFIRIIENLIKNALVHGTGDYCLSLDNLEDNLIISISNRTESIEHKDVDRIFDRFYTTDQSRSRKTTGLGLAIVKRFSEQMGGNVEATLNNDIFMVEVKLPLIKRGETL